MSKVKLIAMAVAAAMTFILPPRSNADAPLISIDEVISRALNESPQVKDIAARIASKRAEGTEASTLQNPSLDSEVRFPVSYRAERGSDEVAVAISQPLRLSDFGSRSRVDELMQQAATAEEKLELLAFSQRVRLAFAKAWALNRRAAEIKQQLDRTATIESDVRRASESGYLSPGERALFRAESLKAHYQLKSVLSDLDRARAELSKTAGYAVPHSLDRPKLTPLPAEETLTSQGHSLPAQERVALAVRLASEQKRLADMDASPKFAPRLVYERTNDYADYLGVGISIDLPVFNRNQAQKTTRSAELAAAQSLNKYFSGGGFIDEVRALRSSLEASTALLVGYENEILPTLRDAVSAEEQLLSSGQGSMFRVWQTLRELSNAEAETMARTVDAFSDRAELAILTGIDF